MIDLGFDYICEGQMSIWDCMTDATPLKFDRNKILRVIELFAGYGSQSMALEKLGIRFEHHKVVEFDKYARNSFNAVHNTNFPVLDIRNITGKDLEIVEKHKYQYLMTYSFPFTDLSVAGAMKGMEEGSGTRSSLLWEVKRLLEESDNLPDILMMENVPQVHGKGNLQAFNRWLKYLESRGYTTVYQDLNAKNYGVAQSRNRCFAISWLGNHTYKFPNGFPLTKTMRDYLEDEVDEKYYLTNEKAKNLIDKLIVDGKILLDNKECARQTVSRAEQSRAEQSRAEQELTYPTAKQPQQISALASKQDTMVESTCQRMSEPECVKLPSYLNYSKIGAVGKDIALTLCSRCYTMSSSEQLSNGVIECQKKS